MAREMKDSGINWVGKIPSNWSVQRNKICFDCSKDIIGDKSAETQLLSLTTKGIKEKRAEDSVGKVPETYDTYQVVVPDDIVMCLFDLDVSAVFSGISPYYGMISPAYKVLKCRHEWIIPKYSAYWFSYVFDGRKFKHYSKNLRYTLNYDEFAVLPIILPSIDEQQRIARFLDTECARIDAVIEQTRASIEEYKKLKQAVITQAVTKGIRPNRPMKDSGIDWIGAIPEEWFFTSIGRIATVVRGASPRPAGDSRFFNGSYLPWITVAEVTNGYGKYITSTSTFLTEEGAIRSRIVEEGTLLLSNSGATLGVPKITNIRGCINDGSVAFYDLQIEKDYLLYILAGRTLELRKQMQGYGQPNLNTTIVKGLYIPLPPTNEQNDIVSYLDDITTDIDGIITQKERLLGELVNYRKALIFEFVTGKKEVKSSDQ